MEQTNAQGLMPPPWLAYPQIERYSIGWRMGSGEDYMNRFGEWWIKLLPEMKGKYQALFPEPITWKGWWRSEDTCECFGSGEYLIELWQPQGLPKYSMEWLRQECAEEQTEESKRNLCMFWMPDPEAGITNGCLSQCWMQEFWSAVNSYSCVEQFSAAQMAELFGDEEVWKEIMECADPKWMKALGRKSNGFSPEIWDMVKYSVALNGNWYKFNQNAELREFLLSTGDSVLTYASPYDEVWGIMLSEEDEEALDPENWQGRNLLGFALMEVRDELRRVWKNAGVCDFGKVEG